MNITTSFEVLFDTLIHMSTFIFLIHFQKHVIAKCLSSDVAEGFMSRDPGYSSQLGAQIIPNNEAV